MWNIKGQTLQFQMQKIYSIVKNDISEERKRYYEKVCGYDKSVVSAFKLAFNRECKNLTLRKRVQILLRKM